MARIGLGVAAIMLALVGATAAQAQGVVMHKDLSAVTAIAMVQAALDTCTKNGNKVSITIVDRQGETLIQVRGDNVSPHTVENSRRKAYTARTFGISSGEFAERVKADPFRWQQTTLPGVIALQGALPIKSGDEIIGAIGVSGSPGGDKDEVCAKAGIDKVADQLK